MQANDTEKQWQTEMETMIADVCGYMGVAWHVVTFDADEWCDRLPELEDQAGRRVSFQKSRGPAAKSRERIYISAGRWPMEPTRGGGQTQVTPYQIGVESPSIEVSRSRGAKVIAAEIQRRFIPAFFAAYAKCEERANSTASWEDKGKQNHAALCVAAGLPVAAPNWRGDLCISVSKIVPDTYGDITVNGDSVDIHFRGVKGAYAVKIVAAIHAAFKGETL